MDQGRCVRSDSQSIDNLTITPARACAKLSPQMERGVRKLRASRGITAFGLVLSISIGIVLGTGGFTFYYAEGGSYLSNNPAACINCHIMNEHFSGWQQSAHHHVAVCNDCHAPHDLIGKYATKADAGFRHSKAFTFNTAAEPLRMIERSRRVVIDNCIECHRPMLDELLAAASQFDESMDCLHCHRGIGHDLAR